MRRQLAGVVEGKPTWHRAARAQCYVALYSPCETAARDGSRTKTNEPLSFQYGPISRVRAIYEAIASNYTYYILIQATTIPGDGT